MLSEYERRELALIEQGLVEQDRRLAESFRPGGLSARPGGRSRRLTLRSGWLARTLLGFGVFLVAIGVLTGADGLFMQGVLFAGAAVVWLRWLRRSAPAPAPGRAPHRRAEGPAPDSRAT